MEVLANPSILHQQGDLFMWHVGIDLHRETVMIAAVNDRGEVIKPVRICCVDTDAIVTWSRRWDRFGR